MIVNKCKDCKYRDREIGREWCANPLYFCRLNNGPAMANDDACENFVTNTIVSTKREKQG